MSFLPDLSHKANADTQYEENCCTGGKPYIEHLDPCEHCTTPGQHVARKGIVDEHFTY